MNTQYTNMNEERSFRPEVDATKLWAGGLATAVVAGLVALVGVLAFRWLFGIPILAPNGPALTATCTRPSMFSLPSSWRSSRRG